MHLAVISPASNIYKLFLFLHIASAIVGFGAVTLNGVYANKALKRADGEATAVTEVNFEVSKIGEFAIYAVFVFGLIVGILGNNHGLKFSDAWLSIAMVLYIIGIGVSHAIVIPAHRKMGELLRAGDRGAQFEAAFKRTAAGGAFLNLLLAVILFLMILKPGGATI